MYSFALLVFFDVLAHLSQDDHKGRAKLFERIGLCFFAVAIVAEILAYPYSQRNDTLSSKQDWEQRLKISNLDTSTQALKTAAETARKQAEGFKAQIAASDAKAKHAEAQVAEAHKSAMEASAKAEGFRLDIAKAVERAANAEKETARLNKAAEDERLARMKIEERLADRMLSDVQLKAIAAKIKEFSGRRI